MGAELTSGASIEPVAVLAAAFCEVWGVPSALEIGLSEPGTVPEAGTTAPEVIATTAGLVLPEGSASGAAESLVGLDCGLSVRRAFPTALVTLAVSGVERTTGG